MSWLDSSAYLLMEGAAQDRLASLRSTATKAKRPKRAGARSSLATLLYVASALRTQTRGIDRYINYFGEPVLSHR
jgi:hypothetical protein